MAITAELHDGTELEFPDGTDPAVIQQTVKRMMGQRQQAMPQQQMPPQKTEVGAVDATGRSFMGGYANTANLLAMAAGGAGVIADKVAGLVTGQPQTTMQDMAFGGLVEPARDAQKYWNIDENTEQLTTGGKIGNVVGSVGSMLQQAVAMGPAAFETFVPTVGARGMVNSALGQAANTVVKAAPQIVQKVLPNLTKGAIVAQPTFAQPVALDRTMSLMDQGVDTDTAMKTGAVTLGGNTMMGALPASAAGNLLMRAGTGAAMNVGTGAATRAGENAVLGDQYAKQQQAALGGKEVGMDALLGAVMAGILGPRAAAAVKASPPKTEWELAEIIARSPQEETGYGPDAFSGIDPNNPDSIKQFTASLNERLFPQDGTGNAPDLNLVKKGTPTPTSAPDPAMAPRAPDWNLEGDGPNRVLGDPDIRGIAKIFGMDEQSILALPRAAQEALRDHANSYNEPKAAFDIAARRQGQADADLANRNEIGPDYQGGGSAAHGGRFDQGVREVTVYGEQPVTILEHGQGSKGDQTTIMYQAEGMAEPHMMSVPTRELRTFQVPENQRMAQDFVARSGEPPKGVGEQTMAGEKMPRRSTDTIAGDEVGGKLDPYNAKPNDRGQVDGTVMPPEPGPGGPLAPRTGRTFEGEMPSQFDGPQGGGRPAAVDGPVQGDRPTPLPAQRTGERTTLLPNNNAPSGDTRFSVDSAGRSVDRTSPPPHSGESAATQAGVARGIAPEVKAEPDAKALADQAAAAETARKDAFWKRHFAPKEPAKREKSAPRTDLLAQLKAEGGIDPSLGRDAGGDSGHVLGRMLPGVMKKGGKFRDYDDVAEWMLEKGWIHDEDWVNGGGVSANAAAQAEKLLTEALHGGTVLHPEDSMTRTEHEQAAKESVDSTDAQIEAKAEGLNEKSPQIKEALHKLAEIKAIRGEDYFASSLGPRLLDAKKQSNLAALTDLINKEHENAKRIEAEVEPKSGGEADGGRVEAQQADNGKGDGSPDFTLERQSESELRLREQQRAESERADREQQQRDEQRGTADDFQLTGSDRKADADPRQADLTDQHPYNKDGGIINMSMNADPLQVKKAAEFLFGNLDDIRENWRNISGDMKDIAKKPLSVMGGATQRILRFAFDSAHGQMRAVANRSKSEVLHSLIDHFQVESGSDRVAGSTFDHSVGVWTSKKLGDLHDALGDLQKDPAAVAQIVKKIRSGNLSGSGATDKAAQKIAGILKESLAYMREAGVDVGEVKNGFYPREFNMDAIHGSAGEFKAAAEQAYREAGHENPKAAADALYDAILFRDDGGMFKPSAGQVKTPFTQERVFGKGVDNDKHPLHKFLEADPATNLTNYLQRASRRAEISRRFGDKFSHWNEGWTDAKGVKHESIVRQLEADGARDAVKPLQDFISLSAGLRNPNLTDGQARLASGLRTWGSLMFLEKATLSSLTEFITPAIRAGGMSANPLAIPANVIKSLHHTIADLMMVSKSAKERRNFAETLGFIHSAMSDNMMAARFAGGDASSKFESRVTGNFFRRIGLTQWTEATRSASVDIGRIYIRSLIHEAADGSGKLATRFLNEMGVPKGQEKAFADHFKKINDGHPGSADLSGPYGDMYRTALGRFLDQSIMTPNRATRQSWASSPLGAVVSQLTSYNYAFYENVWKRVGKLAYDAGNLKNDYSAIERARLLQPLATMPVLVGAAFIIGEGRDELLGDPAKRKKETAGDKALKAASRGAPFAPIDGLLNFVSSARYQKSAAQTFAGPTAGKVGEAMEAIRGVAVNNKKDTNSAERKLAKTAYDLVIEPSVNLGLSIVGVPSPATALATQAVGSGKARDMFVDAVAGKDKKKKP